MQNRKAREARSYTLGTWSFIFILFNSTQEAAFYRKHITSSPFSARIQCILIVTDLFACCLLNVLLLLLFPSNMLTYFSDGSA